MASLQTSSLSSDRLHRPWQQTFLLDEVTVQVLHLRSIRPSHARRTHMKSPRCGETPCTDRWPVFATQEPNLGGRNGRSTLSVVLGGQIEPRASDIQMNPQRSSGPSDDHRPNELRSPPVPDPVAYRHRVRQPIHHGQQGSLVEAPRSSQPNQLADSKQQRLEHQDVPRSLQSHRLTRRQPRALPRFLKTLRAR